jgi:glycosyltransferase involved in cell wall biosynthesis
MCRARKPIWKAYDNNTRWDPPELVKDGVDGFVVLVADASCMAEKMYILAIDKKRARREKMALKTREKAEEFGIDMTTKRFIDALNSLPK